MLASQHTPTPIQNHMGGRGGWKTWKLRILLLMPFLSPGDDVATLFQLLQAAGDGLALPLEGSHLGHHLLHPLELCDAVIHLQSHPRFSEVADT